MKTYLIKCTDYVTEEPIEFNITTDNLDITKLALQWQGYTISEIIEKED